MAKPIISSITPFDVADGTVIKFAYSGEQPYSNKITIYNAYTLDVVYEHTESTMKLRHTIPAGVSELINGYQYAIDVVCYDSDGEASQPSNKAFFWCLSDPVFTITSIVDGKTYDASTITANVYYSQAQFENLASYKFHLYDASKAELFATDMMYDVDNISYTFKGLDNMVTYNVRCEGITARGILVDTGYVEFSTSYEKPSAYSRLYLSQRDGNGLVDYMTNLVIIEDRSGKHYEYSNSMIILDDDILTYDYGFLIDGDFTMAIRHIYAEGTIMRCSNDQRGFELSVVKTPDGTFRYRLKVPNNIAHNILYSEPFSMDENTVCTCWIRRINNVYQIKRFSNQGFTEINNLWIRETQPTAGADNYDLWLNIPGKDSYVARNDVVIWKQYDEPQSAEEDNIWIGGGAV